MADLRDLLISTSEAVISLSKDGTDVDQALLNLCNEIIAQMNVLANIASMQSARIDKLQQRHDALLHIFYSHCQETSIIDPKEIN